MLEQDTASRLRATIEEELGTYRALADLPATAIEDIAAGITRAITPLLDVSEVRTRAA